MGPSKVCEREMTGAYRDEVIPKSQVLRTLRDWMPYLTLFFCVAGFTITMFGYIGALQPISEKTIPPQGFNKSVLFAPSNSSCNTGVVCCSKFTFGDNEAILLIYAVYYHGLAVLGCLQKDPVCLIQFWWSLLGFSLNLALGFGSGQKLLAPVLGWEFLVVTILFVLSVLKKRSGNWGLISLFCLKEHKGKPLYVVAERKRLTRENTSGIHIV